MSFALFPHCSKLIAPPPENLKATIPMTKQDTTTDDTRMPLTSADVLGDRIDGLRELIPEAFVEGKVDFERLKAALGEFVDEHRERYGLSWAGKADAIRNIQSPSVGTLVPCPEESINFDTTENLPSVPSGWSPIRFSRTPPC